MATSVPIPEAAQLFTDAQAATMPRRDAAPMKDPGLADAEEEVMALLWSADPGNQGA